MLKLFKVSAVICLLLLTTLTHARTLPQILQDSLVNDPSLAEARANERIAGSRLEQTEAARWPVVSATGGQRVLSTKSNSDKSFVPTLKSTWTLYDFGKNKAQIARDSLKIDYYSNKTEETAEELIYEIASYYLEALKAKMSLTVAKANLQRHHEIKRMLEIIVQYDPGRRSELTQANSRLLKVESDITNYQRSLGLSLLRIARYIKPAVTVAELEDPFKQLNPNDLVDNYKTTEEELRSHPSYIAQQKELNSIAAELSVAERSRMPSLDVVGMASTDETAVYLNFDVELFNKTTSPGIDEKRHQITAARAQLDQIRRNLTERARLAELKMFQDQSRLFITDSQIKELKQVAMDYEDQFSIAKRTLLEVVNAYRELATVDLFKAETQYDLMIAKLDYLSAVGALREWAGVGDKGLLRTGEETTIASTAQPIEGKPLDTTLNEPITKAQPIVLDSLSEEATIQTPPAVRTNNSQDIMFDKIDETISSEAQFATKRPPRTLSDIENPMIHTAQQPLRPQINLESSSAEMTPAPDLVPMYIQLESVDE